MGNYLGNRKQTNKSTQSTNSSTTNSGTASTSRNLRPEQLDALDAIQARMRALYNPGASLEPIRAAARTGVNQRYAGLPQAVANKTLQGGRSGQFGAGVLQGELGRLGDLGRVDTDIAKLGLDQQSRGDELSMGLLGQNFGSTINSSGTSNTTGTGTATGTDPGNPLAALFASFAGSAGKLYNAYGEDKQNNIVNSQNAARLAMLDRLMRGASSASSPSGIYPGGEG